MSRNRRKEPAWNAPAERGLDLEFRLDRETGVWTITPHTDAGRAFTVQTLDLFRGYGAQEGPDGAAFLDSTNVCSRVVTVALQRGLSFHCLVDFM